MGQINVSNRTSKQLFITATAKTIFSQLMFTLAKKTTIKQTTAIVAVVTTAAKGGLVP